MRSKATKRSNNTRSTRGAKRRDVLTLTEARSEATRRSNNICRFAPRFRRSLLVGLRNITPSAPHFRFHGSLAWPTYVEAIQSLHDMKASFGTLSGLHEEQLEELVVVVIFPLGQLRHADTPPTLYVPSSHSRQSFLSPATA